MHAQYLRERQEIATTTQHTQQNFKKSADANDNATTTSAATQLVQLN